jgi:hypothetical protein
LSKYGFAFGSYSFSFFAIDIPYGRISSNVSFQFNVAADTILSLSAPISPTASDSASSSPLPSPTPLLPVQFGFNDISNSFDLWGLEDLSQLRFTHSGFSIRIPISDMSSSTTSAGSSFSCTGISFIHNISHVSE